MSGVACAGLRRSRARLLPPDAADRSDCLQAAPCVLLPAHTLQAFRAAVRSVARPAAPPTMRHVVVGGGIGGVCCAEELCRAAPRDEVVLVSASPVLKGVTGVVRLAQFVEEFSVVERDAASLAHPNLRVVRGWVAGVDLAARTVTVAHAGGGDERGSAAGEAAQEQLAYDRLCICAGARPKLVSRHPAVVTLRDTESVEALAARLAGARRAVVVGNGGIALELVGAARGAGLELVWVLRHGHIGDAFFDADAAEFLLGELEAAAAATAAAGAAAHARHEGGAPQAAERVQAQAPGQQQQQQQEEQQQGSPCWGGERQLGAALGPKWVAALPGGAPARVSIERNAQLVGVYSTREEAHAAMQAVQAAAGSGGSSATHGTGAAAASEEDTQPAWLAWLVLSGPGGGRVLGADVVVSAIGVEPATEWLPASLARAPDGGLLVGPDLRTSDPHVWAAGDCCSLRQEGMGPHFFQMRLWTQARLMGTWAAQVMAGVDGDSGLSFAFELFTHATRFLGKKVVLLGLYNGQRLEGEAAGDVVTYSRALGEGTRESTFVRLLLLRGRLQGAVLIGDTGLEEAAENLILDALDVGGYGPALLDPSLELDHVFD